MLLIAVEAFLSLIQIVPHLRTFELQTFIHTSKVVLSLDVRHVVAAAVNNGVHASILFMKNQRMHMMTVVLPDPAPLGDLSLSGSLITQNQILRAPTDPSNPLSCPWYVSFHTLLTAS